MADSTTSGPHETIAYRFYIRSSPACLLFVALQAAQAPAGFAAFGEEGSFPGPATASSPQPVSSVPAVAAAAAAAGGGGGEGGEGDDDWGDFEESQVSAPATVPGSSATVPLDIGFVPREPEPPAAGAAEGAAEGAAGGAAAAALAAAPAAGTAGDPSGGMVKGRLGEDKDDDWDDFKGEGGGQGGAPDAVSVPTAFGSIGDSSGSAAGAVAASSTGSGFSTAGGSDGEARGTGDDHQQTVDGSSSREGSDEMASAEPCTAEEPRGDVEKRAALGAAATVPTSVAPAGESNQSSASGKPSHPPNVDIPGSASSVLDPGMVEASRGEGEGEGREGGGDFVDATSDVSSQISDIEMISNPNTPRPNATGTDPKGTADVAADLAGAGEGAEPSVVASEVAGNKAEEDEDEWHDFE